MTGKHEQTDASSRSSKKDDITFAWSSSVRNDLVAHYREIIFHLTERIHWMIGICFLVFSMLLSRLDGFQANIYSSIGSAIILLGSLLSIFILVSGVAIIKNPYTKKRIHTGDLFSQQTIMEMHDEESLTKLLAEIRTDSSLLDSVFSKAIIIETKRLDAKKRVLKLGGNIFLLTFALGAILIMVGNFCSRCNIFDSDTIKPPAQSSVTR